MTELKKGDIHYLVHYQNGEVKVISDITKDNRLDKDLILKRTFDRKTGGQQLYEYYSTELVPIEEKSTQIDSANFGKVNVKIKKDQNWEKQSWPMKADGMVMHFEITDLLGIKESFPIVFSLELIGFKSLIDLLYLVNRVGTVQAAKEIMALELTIDKLNSKLEKTVSKK